MAETICQYRYSLIYATVVLPKMLQRVKLHRLAVANFLFSLCIPPPPPYNILLPLLHTLSINQQVAHITREASAINRTNSMALSPQANYTY
jgi:hypothetical protein